MKVKFLKPDTIETEASRTIFDYGHKFGVISAPPIPIDQILESLLELSLDITELDDGVLGALSFRGKKVWIDASLVPEENPTKEGRYNFTLAHEIGHWQLHRFYYLVNENQISMFDEVDKPDLICRAIDRSDPIEWQANAFAAHLLMPSDMVKEAWVNRYRRNEPYVAEEEISDLSTKWGLADDNSLPTVGIAREMAKDFKVSGQAMQIKLVGMGLIHLKDRGTLNF